jgi:ectoine hydroxylase-related dioxygenase (phytanoyl-CoA dioxygenase family)
MTVLSEEDKTFWEENGYVIVRNAVPQENLDTMIQAIWDFLEVDGNDPENWYHHKPMKRDDEEDQSPISLAGMVEMYQHQAIWDNRQYPRVYGAFRDIWEREDLWVSLDRANMKPPVRAQNPEWDHPGMIHWDVDTSKDPIPFGVQGVLYLTDTAEDQGGFQCVPGFHRTFEEWVKTQPADRNPRSPDLDGLEVKAIPGKAGDLLIWHRLLAHGNGHNRSHAPRLAQYITMSPARFEDEEEREARVSSWREVRPMPRWPGDIRGWEAMHYGPAKLTELGEKLVGSVSWG